MTLMTLHIYSAERTRRTQILTRSATDTPFRVDNRNLRCIGCGACENLCPSRPFSAIYVEGHERHRYI